MDKIIGTIILTGIFVLLYFLINKKKKWKIPTTQFPAEWRKILYENVSFYNSLNDDETPMRTLKFSHQ